MALILPGERGALGEAGPTGTPAGPFILRMPGIAGDASTGQTFDPGVSPSGTRYCRFLPGLSNPAQLGPAPPPPAPPETPEPPHTAVPPAISQDQLARFNELWNTVADLYVDPAYNGLDLDALGDEYEEKILAGYTEGDFALVLKQFINELGDRHSHYQTAEEVAKEAEELANGASVVGIGASILPQPNDSGSVIYVLPGSPAAVAGIRPHDLIVGVNGGPLTLADGSIATRGEAGTTVTVHLRRGGGAVFSLTMVRAAIAAPAPVDSCLVAGTRIGYVFLPTFFDQSIDVQVRAALEKLMSAGPLDGLVLDNRLNGGGLESEAKGVLGFFTSGTQGAYVRRSGSTPFTITPEPIGNSQTVPLVVMVGEGTASFGEIVSGALDRSGRATVVGTTTRGNVELLNSVHFDDGSRVWLAQQTFQPVGLPAGTWEDTGIVPDFTVHGLWHQYTELDDPALARAIAELSD